ncbi:MAG: hypothetical protein AB7F32_06425 [Victivallaceae bacterium]
MSDEPRSYLASDLAAELNVARTTVNDWLARYGAYLEFELRGKRKAYSASSLAVLREVAKLRDDGKAAFEIDAELARKYGIRPEIAPHPDETVEATPGTPAAAPASELPATLPGGSDLALRFSDDQLKKLFGLLEEQEALRRRAAALLRRRVLLIVLLILLGLGIPLVILSGRILERISAESRARRENHQTLLENNRVLVVELQSARQNLEGLKADQAKLRDEAAKAEAESAARLAAITVVLDRNRQDFDANAKRLAAELATQRAAAEAARQADTSRSAELAKQQAAQREEFARTQKALLEKLEAEAAKRAAAEAERTRLQRELEEQRQKQPETQATTNTAKPIPVTTPTKEQVK